ncbi:MAG: aminotransferase class I/II-fold pyridoxal phosphate-dependent enzyme [Crocinitomicaceae bacterium]|nr:aminotransferase class I/II-fold pyridoxal phosphate-dependent enzyme [Crocinitomicaceae bacterium]
MPNYDFILNSKLPKVGTTIFTKMSALAQKTGAVNLSQGFPDFDVDPQLLKLVSKYMAAGHNQYAPMAGAMVLREAIAAKIERLYRVQYNVESEITVTAGATQAIFSAISALIVEGDEVIIFTPAYDCYEPAIDINGGKTIFVKLKSPNYKVDWSEVKRLVSRKTKMINLNTPHNPTGSIWDKHDLEELAHLTKGTGIILLSDEVYEHIIFENKEHQSVLKHKELRDRSLVVASFGKTFHVTGWKMGYIVGPSSIMKEFKKVHQFNVFCCNHPMQLAIASYISNEDNYLHLGSFYEEKRNLFNEAAEQSRFGVLPSSGTYFQLLDYSRITNEDDVQFAERLTEEFKIASIPVSVFYNTPDTNKVLRFCFAKQNETLERAGEILLKI